MAKQNPQYFEGILQLRRPSRDVISFVKLQFSRRKNVSIAKESLVRNGIDLYVSSNPFLIALGKRLKENFPGVMKVSSKLHTRKQGRDMYRVTVLFECSPFRKGDMIIFNGEEEKVMSVTDKVALKNMKTGKRKSYPYRDVLKQVKAR